MALLCSGDVNCILRFTIKKDGEISKKGVERNYGFFVTTLDLIMKRLRSNPVWELYDNKGKVYHNSWVEFESCDIRFIHSFSEYLKSGWHINLSVAIDYSASNGDPLEDPNSLHQIYSAREKKNQYETVITQVGNILSYYAYQKKFFGYGFGGIPNFMENQNDFLNLDTL